MSRLTVRTRYTIISTFLISMLIITVTTSYLLQIPQHAHAQPVQPGFNHFLSTHYNDDGQYDDNSGPLLSGPEQELYDDRAYPQDFVSYNQAIGAYNAFQSVSWQPRVTQGQSWRLIGPRTGNTPAPVTYSGRATTVSGRVTAIAVSNSCGQNVCRVWVGAAGGGIWTTDNGLAAVPTWRSSSSGLASNAIGSIVLDPNDSTGATLYVGTGDGGVAHDSTNEAQDLNSLYGKILRIDVESGVAPYAIPPSNPFVNHPGSRPDQ